MDKKQLRQWIRQRKREMTEAQIVEKSRRLKELFCATQAYREARTLYGYLPYNQEVRTVPILEQAWRDGKQVAVPKCYGDTMKFIVLHSMDEVASGSYGIPEPVQDGPVANDPTALVMMPGLAFDKQGNRMGYGGGYYDKFLSDEPHHPTIALCYDFQIVEQIPTEDYDIPVDEVLWA